MKTENIQDIYELSPIQQGILFHSLYAPETGVYFVQLCYALRGNLDVAAFEQAWQQVVARHTALRTAFYWEMEKPIQVVYRQVKVPFSQHDWRKIEPIEQQQRLQEFLVSDRASGFDFSQECLMRLTLIRCADDSYYFVWSKHHLILDGWSTALVLKEVVEFYTALRQGQMPSRPNTFYGDYISWLQQQDLSKAKAYWQQALKGIRSPTPLIDLDVGMSSQEERYDEQQIKLSATTTAALQSLARQHQLTLNTLVQGAWALLLSRYSGEADVVYGVTVSGRPTDLMGAESMVGLFINTLPVRVKVEAEECLLKWLLEIQAQLVEIREYEYSPLVEVQGWSDVPRGFPLVESILVFENYPIDRVLKDWQSDLEIQNISAFDNTNYPLTVTVIPGYELEIAIAYNCRRFDAATITRMLGHLQTLLAGMVTNPQQCLKELSLLTASEQYQLLVEWNNTQIEYPHKCIHHLFEAQVEQTPNAVAVVFEQSLTYQELNQRANKIAHYLQKLGVGPDVLVGICVERSEEMAIAVLGVLKAGGAYVPLDPIQPPQRLAFMLQDAGCQVLLTQKRLKELPTYTGKVVCLDADWELSQEEESNLNSKVQPENLAYVIYTSGSTGQAKGVMVKHSSLVNAYLSWEKVYQLRSQTSCHLQMANFSFDVFSGDLIRALCSGGKLVLCPREFLLEPQKLYELMLQQKVDCAEFVPVVLRTLIQYLEKSQQRLDFMRLVICGSDSWYGAEYRKFREFLGVQTRLINSFGLTEATIDSSYFESATTELPAEQLVPIGRPFANTQLYILDSGLQPVPIGVPGELHIGGASLARGYHNRPDLTAEKFIPNIFSDERGARMYKTGDLARYLPNKNIEFLGRIDYQVKIRGFRIELGEIEAVLNQHPKVRQAVILERSEELGEKHLVAYVVPKIQNLKSSELRNFLKQRLPEYMIPSAFVLLEALPLTPNGKVDRRSLPATDAEPELADTYVAPRTAVEEVLAGIWVKILRVQRVGIHDNFFELGGHSLLATQVTSRIREAFQVELPLRCLFESPSVAQLSQSIMGIECSQMATISPRASADNLPLSFAQQRLWFLNQLEPDSPLYNITAAFRLTGSLNIPALEHSFNEIVKRHEALRTTFAVDRPVQVVASEQIITITVIDLRELPVVVRSAEVERLTTEEQARPFDLARGPLLRGTLLRLDDAEYVFLFAMHHIVSDGWSTDVLVREVAVLYECFLRGKPSPLPELPIQYADYAIWQREWLQGEVLKTQLGYWKQQLGGDLPVLELPTDRPRPNVQTHRGATQSFQMSDELAVALKALSQQESSTLFMTLLAAFKTLLFRYTGTEDIVVGSPIANRNRAEIEGLIGFFVNTLVLRTDLSDNPTFGELLGRVRDCTLSAYTHQDLPFDLLVEELRPQRDLSHTPLFQVTFVLQNAPMSAAVEFSGLTLKPLESNTGTAKFDLSLIMEETETGLQGAWVYNTDLFDAETITRMGEHFQNLLVGIVANPQQRIAELPLLTASERHQLLEWNNAQAEYPLDKCIHQLFEAQVERTPDAVAVVFEDQQLTYRELNARANKLAHYLQAIAVEPEVLVGICMERSLEMVVGLLGTLKAGGAYVPLDPTYPQERLVFMIEDARVSVLLTQERLVDLLVGQGRIVCLDRDWEAIAQASDSNPASISSDNLAYVIYTSGSTGKPKGVAIAHRALCNHMFWMQADLPLTPKDRVLQKTPFSFDASVWEFYAPLLTGGQLILARPGGHQDSAYLIELIAQQQVTILQLVPSLLRMLLEEKTIASAKSLQRVFCGGESLPIELCDRFFNRLESVDLHNLYGPTEATIDTTFWTCKRQDKQRTVPIGRAIANAQIYLLDSHLQFVPVGVPGEIYIGGEGLARGYLNQPELTAAKFIPNPFPTVGKLGTRLYKTGDLARYRPDGTIEFLGRIDQQVKIRGFRIELEEIEALLSQHPKVRETVVLVRQDFPGEKRLVAYVVPQEQSPTVSELRSFLKQKLPEFMVPSVFLLLNALPLLPNGKVDRKSLPAPDTGRPELGDFVSPRTAIEETLVQIWKQVLRVEKIGVYDNFFELGGDSIHSLQAIAKANQAGLQLTPKQLFEHQTIAELAAVSGTKTFKTEQGIVTGSLPLTPIQHWFFEQALADPHHWNQAVMLEVHDSCDPILLEQVVQQLLEHHDALRLRFVQTDSGWQSINAAVENTTHVAVVDLSALSQNEQTQAIEVAAAALQTSLNLTEGPLVRVALFELGAKQPNRLLIVIHHLVVDGVSWRILLEDLQTVYQQRLQGKAVQLPPKTTSYKQWAELLTEYAQSAAVRSQLDYWLSKSRQQSLPVDFPRGDNTVASSGTVSVALSQEETQALLYEVPAAYQTQINDVLLTALVQAFEQWTGERSLLVDLEGHGREEIIENIDLSRTVGWFTTIFPVLLDLGEASHPGEALKAVKEQLRSIPQKGIGYGVLRYLSSSEESSFSRRRTSPPAARLSSIIEQLQALPEAEVKFNYLGQFDQVLSSSMFRPAPESCGPTQSQWGNRDCLLEVNGIVVKGQLRLDWTYSKAVHQQTTIEKLAGEFIEALRSLIAHCQSPTTGGYTPSDFPQMQLNQTELDRLIAELNECEGDEYE